MRTEILIIGEGGQGIKKLAQILGKALDKTYYTLAHHTYGTANKGDVSCSYVIFSDQSTISPFLSSPTFIINLLDDKEKYEKITEKFIAKGININEAEKISRCNLFLKEMLKELKNNKVGNMVMLGVISALLRNKVDWLPFINGIQETFNEKYHHINILAFLKGYEKIVGKENLQNHFCPFFLKKYNIKKEDD